MVGGVFVGQQADLLQWVEDQAVVAEADVVSVAFFEDARLDAVGPAVGEAVLDHVAGKFFDAQGEMVSPGAVAAVLVAEFPDGICEGHYVIHLGDGYIEFILLEHVESVREQEDPVPESFAVDFDAAALNCNDDAVEHPDQVHGRQAKGDSDQISPGLREEFRVVPGSAQSACDGSREYDEKEHKRRSKSCGKNAGQGEDLLGLLCFAGSEKSCEAVAGACDDHCANDGEGDHERVDNSESGDGVHAEELADHYAVDHGAHGRREREQDEGGQLYVKGISDNASAGVHFVSKIE